MLLPVGISGGWRRGEREVKMDVSSTFPALLVFLLVTAAGTLEIDENGYVLFCPCMGRFGNQADHYLGSLAFAKGLNRTMVLPPWVEYHTGKLESVQVPFDTYFKVEALEKFHRVITMERFMKELAPSVWPPGNRTAFCYSSRGTGGQGCNAKDGNPFGPFWNTFNVDFANSEFFGPLLFGVHNKYTRDKWNEQYPSSKYPVLPFTGAPASFPVIEENKQIQKYFKWSDYIREQAEQFIMVNFPEGPWVGIHIRNGVDFKRACDHIERRRNMFASPQCLGYLLEHGDMSLDLCYPPKELILKDVLAVVKKIKAKAVFVATDDNPLLAELKKTLKKLKVNVVRGKEGNPHVDLAILAMSDHYIGNCVSSFSAFAARERLVNGNKPTSFWAFKPRSRHDEF